MYVNYDMKYYPITRILIKYNLQTYMNILSFYVQSHLNMKLVFTRKLVSYAIKIINSNNIMKICLYRQ